MEELKWNQEIWEGVLRCVEGFYIFDDDSKDILFVNSFLCGEKKESHVIGRKCYEVFADRQSPCPYCPPLKACTEEEKPYVWDHYNMICGQWVKVKNCLVVSGGRRYRVGNVNLVEDMMGLSSDAVREMGAMNRMVQELDRMKELMASEISHDRLTRLLNRNQYMKDLEGRYSETGPVGVLFFDLNNLKEINDSYHHSEGDRLLCRMADAMMAVEKTLVGERGGCGRCDSDITGKIGCYRIGGDEFLMIWEGCTRRQLEQCRSHILGELDRRNENERFSCSVASGAAWSNPCGKLERLVSEADKQMYKDKNRMKGLTGRAGYTERTGHTERTEGGREDDDTDL